VLGRGLGYLFQEGREGRGEGERGFETVRWEREGG